MKPARPAFVVALVVVFLAVSITFSVQLYKSQSEATNLMRQVFNMESEIRIAKARCR